MKTPKRTLYLALALIVSIFATCKILNVDEVSLTSPNDSISYTLSPEAISKSYKYSILYKGKEAVAESAIGFLLGDDIDISKKLKIVSIEESSQNKEWEPLYGEKSSYKNNYNEAIVKFKTTEKSPQTFSLRVRAYNEGIAFRYEFENKQDLVVQQELTTFNVPQNAQIWASKRAQDPIQKVQLSDLSFAAEQPLLIESSKELYLAIGEAAQVDFARMSLVNSEKENSGLGIHLCNKFDHREYVKDYDIKLKQGSYNTPWRYIMLGDSPSEILANNGLILNLNEPNKIENTAYIKPGKVLREVTLTTQGGLACVDFCKKHNLQYVEFDAGWYGNEYDDASDATTVTVDPKRSKGVLGLQKVIDYAKKKDIGVILYVNRRSLEKQLDDVLHTLKSWGVAGLKYGFVNVGPQYWTDWLTDAVRKAADHELMVDIHDEYRPTGYSRTYPNLMTQEGIRGDEESTPNSMVINTIFTRMIAGAGDQTNCFLDGRVENNMGSRASQMAKMICIYSPWQFVFWYDRPPGSPLRMGGAGESEGVIPDVPEIEFYEKVPCTWDDTKIIEGYPEEYATIARRSGNDWYVGALTGKSPRDFSFTLDFLDRDKKYMATIYSNNDALNSEEKVKIIKLPVTSSSILKQKVDKQNGFAVIITENN